jgi:hypothetical protein
MRLRDKWEAVCRKCGRCCFEKDRRGGRVVTNWRAPCRFLDKDTRCCSVYAERFRVCPECRKMTVFHAFFAPWLPPECGYVRAFRPGG